MVALACFRAGWLGLTLALAAASPAEPSVLTPQVALPAGTHSTADLLATLELRTGFSFVPLAGLPAELPDCPAVEGPLQPVLRRLGAAIGLVFWPGEDGFGYKVGNRGVWLPATETAPPPTTDLPGYRLTVGGIRAERVRLVRFTPSPRPDHWTRLALWLDVAPGDGLAARALAGLAPRLEVVYQGQNHLVTAPGDRPWRLQATPLGPRGCELELPTPPPGCHQLEQLSGALTVAQSAREVVAEWRPPLVAGQEQLVDDYHFRIVEWSETGGLVALRMAVSGPAQEPPRRDERANPAPGQTGPQPSAQGGDGKRTEYLLAVVDHHGTRRLVTASSDGTERQAGRTWERLSAEVPLSAGQPPAALLVAAVELASEAVPLPFQFTNLPLPTAGARRGD